MNDLLMRRKTKKTSIQKEFHTNKQIPRKTI